MTKPFLALIACALLFLAPTGRHSTFAQSSEEPLLSVSCGVRQDGASCKEFNAVMRHRQVQSLVLDIASEPRQSPFVNDALNGSGVTSTRLEQLGVIRRDGDQYVLSFFLYTKGDLNKLREVAELQGQTLAAAYLRHRAEIDALLGREARPETDLKGLAFFLVGCVSLDWDGLNLADEKAYTSRGPLSRYALQRGGGGDVRGLYWGSHNWHDPIALTSFGDHASLPRMAFPDINFMVDVPAPLKSHLQSVAAMLMRRHVGTVMIALRDGPREKSYLAKATALDEADTEHVLQMLLQLRYVAFDGERYRAIIPVLSERDAPMVQDLRRLGRQIMLDWLAEHHPQLQRQLADLSSIRQGVPLSEGFWWVWHYVFGVANRELVRSGLLADPYDPAREFKGFIPAVYPLHVVMGRDSFDEAR